MATKNLKFERARRKHLILLGHYTNSSTKVQIHLSNLPRATVDMIFSQKRKDLLWELVLKNVVLLRSANHHAVVPLSHGESILRLPADTWNEG